MSAGILLFLLLASGCGEKKPPASSAQAEAPSTSASIPGDATSRAFAKRLLAADLSGYRPVENGGATLSYSHFRFDAAGRWNASGRVEVMDESIDCQESGTWLMDPAETETTADMTWKLVETTCPGRSGGSERRVQLTLLPDGRFKVAYH